MRNSQRVPTVSNLQVAIKHFSLLRAPKMLFNIFESARPLVLAETRTQGVNRAGQPALEGENQNTYCLRKRVIVRLKMVSFFIFLKKLILLKMTNFGSKKGKKDMRKNFMVF